MTTINCDCCGVQIGDPAFKTSRVFKLELLVHILNEKDLNGYSTHINGGIHDISGRTVVLDLCLPCYNEIAYAAADKFSELKGK